MKRNQKCPSCGLRVESTYRYCLACGAELEPTGLAPQSVEEIAPVLAVPAGVPIKCPSCSETVLDSYAVCPACGADLSEPVEPKRRGKAKTAKAPKAAPTPKLAPIEHRSRKRPIALMLIALIAVAAFAGAIFSGVLDRDKLDPSEIRTTASELLEKGEAAGKASGLPEGVPSNAVSAEVVRVRGGDSVVVKIDGVETILQLAGSNAPSANECFGAEAKERLGKLLKTGSTVYVWRGTVNGETIPGYVWRIGTSDNAVRWVNQELLSGGFATVDATLDGGPSDAATTFESAQSAAKRAARGLWATCEGLTPEPESNTRG